MPGELFETEAWFAHLLAHGFEHPSKHFAPHLKTRQDVEVESEHWHEAVGVMRELPRSAVMGWQPLDVSSAWLTELESGLRAKGYWTDRIFLLWQLVSTGASRRFFGTLGTKAIPISHIVQRGRRRLAQAWSCARGRERRLDVSGTDLV